MQPIQGSPMKKVAIILGLIVLGIAVWMIGSALFIKEDSGSNNNSSSTSLLTYTDGTTGATIQYPTSWTETQAQPGTISFAHSSGANVTFVVEALADETITLEAYSEAAIAGLENLGESFELLDESESTTAGYESTSIAYTITGEETTVKAKGSWFVENGYAYILSYTAPTDLYAKYEKTGEEIIESIEL